MVNHPRLRTTAIGALVPSFTAVSNFCCYTAIGLVFIYIWNLIFFGAILAYFTDNQWDCKRWREFYNKQAEKFDFVLSEKVFKDWLPCCMEYTNFKLFIVIIVVPMLVNSLVNILKGSFTYDLTHFPKMSTYYFYFGNYFYLDLQSNH